MHKHLRAGVLRRTPMGALMVAIVATSLLAASQASAHVKTWTGTIKGPKVSLVPRSNPDLLAFQAAGCADWTDGLTSAVLNTAQYGRHRIRVEVTAPTVPNLIRVAVYTWTSACQDPNIVSETPGSPGSAAYREPLVFTLPSDVKVMLIENISAIAHPSGSTAVNVSYRITADHP